KALIVVPRLLSPATRTVGTSCPARGRSICAHSGSCGEGFYLTFKGDVYSFLLNHLRAHLVYPRNETPRISRRSATRRDIGLASLSVGLQDLELTCTVLDYISIHPPSRRVIIL
ncbi:hypothetical protein B0H16DRAFT_1618262, partial [Mycena metata]